MKITKNLFNEDVPQYESAAECDETIRAYLAGEYSLLTQLEIMYFRQIERDTDGKIYAAMHAGQIASDVDQAYLTGMRFVFGNDILSVPHPITNWYLYHLELDLFESMDAEDLDFYKEMKGKENE